MTETGNHPADLQHTKSGHLDSHPKGLSLHATFYLNSAYAKLGWSLTTADVNHDGVDDVLVGAPGFEGYGCVFVVFGDRDVTIWLVFLDHEVCTAHIELETAHFRAYSYMHYSRVDQGTLNSLGLYG